MNAARAQSPKPASLQGIFSDKGDADLDAVKNDASSQSQAAPFYKSNGLETRDYEGDFVPAKDTSKLALLSDDGTSVWIDGTQVLGNAGQNQGFEHFDSTFSPLGFTFSKSHVYHLRLHYTNTIHSGDADVDGVTLFAYDGGGSISNTKPLEVKVTADQTNICAGGWDQGYNNGAGGYGYLSKETGAWVARDRSVGSKDPHVKTLTATVTGGNGDLAGRTVTFHCDMPGPDPEQDPTATTDAHGIAKATIISGNQLSRDTDDKGNMLFDEPVTVDATCTQGDEEVQDSLDLNVLAPSIEWQYKDDQGDYSHWNGQVYDLYEKPSYHSGIPLQAVLTFNKTAVFGHRVSWAIDHIYDKAGEEVLPREAEYSTYGRMSGHISTTTQKGAATATFTYGYNFGQLVFDISDASVLTPDISDASVLTPDSSAASSPRTSESSGHLHQNPKTKKYYYTTDPVGEYDYVKGKPTSVQGLPDDSKANSHAYPAPSGEEDGRLDDEILAPTLHLVRDVMSSSVGRESQTGSRVQTPGRDIREAGSGKRYLQNGYWWFSQCVGNDAESSGTHLADLKMLYDTPLTGKSGYHYFSGAFDIVLTKVPIFKHAGRVKLFGPPLWAMRNQGIVAWHRWAGETGTTSENEMHCIDPSTPYLKKYLKFQINQFLRSDGKGTGGRGYDTEPTDPLLAAWEYFHIDPAQQTQVRWRRAHQFDKLGMERDNITP